VKNILFTSLSAIKLSIMILGIVFSMGAVPFVEASKPHFLNYDQNGVPTTAQYTSKRGVHYNLGERTMDLRSSPSKHLWDLAPEARKPFHGDAILESPPKGQKTFDPEADLVLNFDETPPHLSPPIALTPTPSTLMSSKSPLHSPHRKEMQFDAVGLEMVPFNTAPPLSESFSFEIMLIPASAFHRQSYSGENEHDEYHIYLVDAVEKRKGRMVEHFEMIEELERLDSESA
jgi:hypothetical protein